MKFKNTTISKLQDWDRLLKALFSNVNLLLLMFVVLLDSFKKNFHFEMSRN